MEQNNVVSFNPLLEKDPLVLPNPAPSPPRPRKPFLQRWNVFMMENYMIMIIISFALIFVLVPFMIFEIKRSRYSHLFRNDSDGILQPLSETRDFRWIQLGNEMNVMLISDPDLYHSGASLEIDVGSSYDPKEIPGLAHFLEHMLFMGSKKYHNVSHFKDFINLNGGKTNAFTSDDYTKFYFTVNNGEFDTALEIFSHFFIDPLFDPSRVEKEILAVHNEYEMNLQKNIWRFFELLRRNSNPKHSFHRFTCGNLKSLKLIPEMKNLKIQEEVIKFFKNYYSSHKMKLVLIGNHHLDVLEKMVIDKFNLVKNHKKTYQLPAHLINMPPAYPPSYLGKFIWYKTIGKQKMISIVFPLNVTGNMDPQVNPVDFLSQVVSLEGENGLKWNLMKKGWITSLESDIIQKTPDFLHFAVMISLSDAGVVNTLAIVEEFFYWIKQIRKQGVSKSLYKQFRAVSYLNFLFSKKKSLEDDLINLVSNLNALSKGEISFENIVAHKEVFMKYNGSIIREVLDQFKVQNSLVVLGAGDLEIEQITNTEKFKTYFNETIEFDNVKFTESDFFNNSFDYDNDVFQNMKVFTHKKLDDKSKRFVLKPNKFLNLNNTEMVQFRESIVLDKSQTTFEELMEETFTYCDYISKDPYEMNVNNNYYDYEFFTVPLENLNHDYSFTKGSTIKCSADYNDSLLYFKKLNKYDEIMKINYASENINSSTISKIDESHITNFDNFSFKIPVRFVPKDLEMKSYCSHNNEKVENKKLLLKNNVINIQKEYSSKPNFIKIMNEIFDDFDTNEITYNSYFKSQCFYDEILGDLTNEYPIKIAQNLSKTNVWLKTDRTFLIPKTDIKIFIRINDIDQGKEKVILGVIVDIINNRNKELLYDAQLLKYKASLVAHQKGIEMQINGFSDKIALLMENLMDFEGFFENMQKDEFEVYLTDIKNFYENLNKAQSLQQLQKYLHKILRKNYLSNKEILSFLNEITVQDLKVFLNKIFENFELNILFVGNILPSEANDLSTKITKTILGKYYAHNQQTSTNLQNTSILNVSEKFNSVFLMNNSNSDDENSAIINYYQIGERNDADYVKSVVISTLLNSEAFNFLRTEKQLGYVVHSNIFSVKNVDGFLIGIQGSNNPPDLMNKYVEEFLFRFFDIIANKSETQFQNILTHVSQNFLFKDPDLNSLSERLWEEICFGKNDFKKYERYFRKISNLTKTDIIDFFQKIFKVDSKKISLQLYKTSNLHEKVETLNSTENYGQREEKIVKNEELKNWVYFQRLE